MRISDGSSDVCSSDLIFDSAQVDINPEASSDNLERAAQKRLSGITPASRQALLLTTLEGFSSDDAAVIMNRSEAALETLVNEAIGEINRQTATSVLIIEDEPLISMQLESLVTQLDRKSTRLNSSH